MNRFNITPKKAIILGIILLLAIITSAVIHYVATHGVIRIVKSADAEYVLFGDDYGSYAEAEKSKDLYKVVKTGDYGIELKDANGLVQKRISVPGWYSEVRVDLSVPKEHKVTRVAAGTLDRVVAGPDNTYISFSTTANVTDTKFIHTPADPSGTNVGIESVTPTSTLGIVSNGRLIALQDDGESFRPYVYDQTLGSVTTLDDPGSDVIPGIVASSAAGDDHFALTFAREDNLSLQVYDGTNKAGVLDSLDGASRDDTGHIMASVAGQTVAVGFGNNSRQNSGDTEERLSASNQPETPRDFVVRIYNSADGKLTKTINLGSDVFVDGLSVSADGSRLAVMNGSKLDIYNTDVGTKLFSFEGTSYRTPTWIGNGRLVFGDYVGGLLQYDESQDAVTSLLAPGILTVGMFTVTGEDILFNASRANDTNSERPATDAYRLSLNSQASNDNILTKKLPYSDDEIVVMTLNDTIYATPFVMKSDVSQLGFVPGEIDQATKQKITDYLRTNIPNYTEYTLVYGYNLL